MEQVRKISSMYSMLLNGFKGCILVFEYTYFVLQTNGDGRNALHIAVKEYQSSGTQASVLTALQHAIKEYGNDHDVLRQAIIDIIITNRMCKLIFFKTT